jgi:hypothetical protein
MEQKVFRLAENFMNSIFFNIIFNLNEIKI